MESAAALQSAQLEIVESGGAMSRASLWLRFKPIAHKGDVMATVPISVLFSGLIAFVSTDSVTPSNATAYLPVDPDHVQMVIFTGKVNIDTVGDSTANCTSFVIGGRTEIVCLLGKTDILFDPMIKKGELFPDRPPHEGLPASNEISDGRWILRMKNINGFGEAASDIESRVGAKMVFGWNSIESCALDGQEMGKRGKPALIGFRSFSGNLSGHRRAVAECLMFKSEIEAKPVTIKLQDRGGQGRPWIIKADCSVAPCLAINVVNHLKKHTTCSQNIVEGKHYLKYYGLLENQPTIQNQMIPFSIKVKCKKSENNRFPAGLLEYGLRALHPVAAGLEKAIREQVGTPRAVDQEKLVNIINDLLAERFKHLKKSSQQILDIVVFHPREVMDRVICPPTVLER